MGYKLYLKASNVFDYCQLRFKDSYYFFIYSKNSIICCYKLRCMRLPSRLTSLFSWSFSSSWTRACCRPRSCLAVSRSGLYARGRLSWSSICRLCCSTSLKYPACSPRSSSSRNTYVPTALSTQPRLLKQDGAFFICQLLFLLTVIFFNSQLV